MRRDLEWGGSGGEVGGGERGGGGRWGGSGRWGEGGGMWGGSGSGGGGGVGMGGGGREVLFNDLNTHIIYSPACTSLQAACTP